MQNFKKGDPRINRKGPGKGTLHLTTRIKQFLLSQAKDGEQYAQKFTKAGVLRAIVKSDVLWKEIIERMDGKIVEKSEVTHTVPVPILQILSKNKNVKNT